MVLNLLNYYLDLATLTDSTLFSSQVKKYKNSILLVRLKY